MVDDIVPDLLESIEKDFMQQTTKSAKIKKAFGLLKSKKATYLDVNEFSIEIGEILSSVLQTHITASALPDGKMYYNVADRILNKTMKNNYDLISGYASDVQLELNKAANLGLKSKTAELNQNRINGLVNRLSRAEDFEVVSWLLDEPIINFSQSVVDDTIKANVDFHAKAGLQPKLTRTVTGHACKWCMNLAGSYDYGDAPDDIYRRHERCRCIVEYNPKDGRGVQNSHTKKWRDPQKDAKIEMRKAVRKTAYRRGTPLKLGLQIFAEKDIQNQSTNSLIRAIRNYEKQITIHKEKIANPEKFVKNWDEKHPGYKTGIIKHWNKEIFNFNKSIRDRKDEIARRGD